MCTYSIDMQTKSQEIRLRKVELYMTEISGNKGNTTILLAFRLVLLLVLLTNKVKGNTHSGFSSLSSTISPSTLDKFKIPHPLKDDPKFRHNACVLSHFMTTCLDHSVHPINFGNCARA